MSAPTNDSSKPVTEGSVAAEPKKRLFSSTKTKSWKEEAAVPQADYEEYEEDGEETVAELKAVEVFRDGRWTTAYKALNDKRVKDAKRALTQLCHFVQSGHILAEEIYERVKEAESKAELATAENPVAKPASEPEF